MGATPLVVLDTNVLVSAIGWRGPEWELYAHVRSGTLRLATSPALLDELRRVLAYPKLRLDRREIAVILADVTVNAQLVHPSQVPLVVAEDPADDQVLACATAAGAAWIVSGDQHLLALDEHEGIPIVTARKLLDLLAQGNSCT